MGNVLVWDNFTPIVFSGLTKLRNLKPVNPAAQITEDQMSRLHGLYAITDDELISPKQFKTTIEQILQGGARIVQYRNKSDDKTLRQQQGIELRKLCNQYKALFIINDDIELATHVHADGVHLGRDDNSISEARKQLGDAAIIGASCYNRIDLAQQAQKAGADYIAFGSFFSSTVKPDACTANIKLLQLAKQHLSIPVCAIGGINIDNATQLVEGGVDMIAVITGLLAEKNITSAAQKLSALFSEP
jgi:thiamine-phosphate pyrophosphorylase